MLHLPGILPSAALFVHLFPSRTGRKSVTMDLQCINRPNRYDIMIEMEMDPEALTVYDACEAHKKWKQEYGDLLQKKTIFDSED